VITLAGNFAYITYSSDNSFHQYSLALTVPVPALGRRPRESRFVAVYPETALAGGQSYFSIVRFATQVDFRPIAWGSMANRSSENFDGGGKLNAACFVRQTRFGIS